MIDEDDALFGPLSTQICFDLTAISLALFERYLMHDQARREQAAEDLASFRGALSPYRNHQGDPLWMIREALRGRLQEFPLAAMLAEESRAEDHATRVAGEALTAWVLAAVLRRMQRSPGQAAIRSAQDATRLLKRSKHSVLSRFRPVPQTMEGVSRSILLLLDEADLPNTVRSYLERIQYLFKATLEDRDAIFRQTTDRSGAISARGVAQAVTHLSPQILPDPLAGLDWLSAGSEDGLQDPELAGPLLEQEVEDSNTKAYAKAKASPRHLGPRRIAKRRLSQVVKAIGKRQLSLGADSGSMSPIEIKTLIAYCLDHCDQGSLSILCQLIYGTALRLTSEPRHILQEYEGQLVLEIDLQLPEFPRLFEEEEDHAADFIPEGSLYLELPYGDATVNLAEQYEDIDGLCRDDVASQHLETAQAAITRPHSWSRIAGYKADWLRRQGCDAAIIGFLTGASPSHRAQLHYSKVCRSLLVYWHRRYMHEALGLHNVPFPDAAGTHGSRLDLPKKGLREIFAEQENLFVQWRRKPGLELPHLAARHNAYTSYCLMLLYFASGHRPVGNPFERLADMDLESGLIWISDKTSSGNRGARILILPHIARRQLAHWCTYLERLQHRLKFLVQPNIDARIRAALDPRASDQAPLFFYWGLDDVVIEPSASQQRSALQEILPAALNWSRHLLRSDLLPRLNGELIDAWMGHAHYGETAFKKSSGLGLGDLRRVADEIDQLLTEYGVAEVEPFL